MSGHLVSAFVLLVVVEQTAWGLAPGGRPIDGQHGIGYNAATGEVWFNQTVYTDRQTMSWWRLDFTSINIASDAGIFTGEPARHLDGRFDNDADDNIFKATFGSSFGTLSFGRVAQPNLTEEFLLNDLRVVGSCAGGCDLGTSKLVYHSTPPLRAGGKRGDAKSTFIYDYRSGAVTVDISSVDGSGVIGLFSRDHLFHDVPDQDLPIESNHALFMPIASVGEFSLDLLLPAELDEQLLLDDLSVVADGIGAVDLLYVPEPSCNLLLMTALIVTACCIRWTIECSVSR